MTSLLSFKSSSSLFSISSIYSLDKRHFGSIPEHNNSIKCNSITCISARSNVSSNLDSCSPVLTRKSFTFNLFAACITALASESVFSVFPANSNEMEGQMNNTTGDKKTSLSSKPETPLEGILSFFDSDELTSSGKILPKSYLKSAREVIRTLKESLAVDPNQDLSFRKSASSAKDSIKEFLSKYRSSPSEEAEVSFNSIQAAIRELATFYSKQGPRAVMPEKIKEKILEKLELAESSF